MTSKGVLFFAFNNNEINYAKLANFAASRVKKYLNCEITVVTNSPTDFINSPYVDNVLIDNVESPYKKIFHDGKTDSKHLTWINTSRYTCYNLSPYDETLVLDVDYIINSPTLSYCWDSKSDFLIYKDSLNLSLSTQNNNLKFISEYSIPFYWATVFYFKKTKLNESFFNLVHHIKENWSYYRLLYQITSTNFRNDFAFSIAIHMFNGFSNQGFADSLPGKLYYSFDTDHVFSLEDDNLKLLVDSNSGYVPIKIKTLDVHLMNKFNLLEILNSHV